MSCSSVSDASSALERSRHQLRELESWLDASRRRRANAANVLSAAAAHAATAAPRRPTTPAFSEDETNASEHQDIEVDRMIESDQLFQYLSWLGKIQTIGTTLEQSLEQGQASVMIATYLTFSSLVRFLCLSRCSVLRSFAADTFHFWHGRIVQRVSAEFGQASEALKWPQCLQDDSSHGFDFTSVAVERFQKAFHVLYQLSAASSAAASDGPAALVASSAAASDGPAALVAAAASESKTLAKADPFDILMKPLRKRFKFHFSGAKKTNNMSKPEWYINQILVWMRRSKHFFDALVQPALEDEEESCHERLAEKLLRLLSDKLQVDVEELSYDDLLLSHVIDEILQFTKEMDQMNYSHLEDEPSSRVLSNERIIKRWISIERKFSEEKIDEMMMLDENAWSPAASKPDVSQCTDNFVALLRSMTHRFQALPSHKAKLEFVALQCSLLEDLRMRFVQVHRQEKSLPLSSKYCLIVNSCEHIGATLDAWSMTPLFLRLQYEKFDPSGDGNNSLFARAIGGFHFIVDEATKILSEHIFYEAKSRSRAYRTECNWHDRPESQIWPRPPSHQALAMMHVLASKLQVASENLAAELFERIIGSVAHSMKLFFIQEIIFCNTFNVSGGLQLETDVREGLVPLFRRHVTGPEIRTFDELLEICSLLAVGSAHAHLLADALQNTPHGVTVDDIRKEYGLKHCSKDKALKILHLRLDIITDY